MQRINYTEVIKVAEEIYPLVNPNTTKDIPSMFYERVEIYYKNWLKTAETDTFLEYCKYRIKNEKNIKKGMS